MTISVEGAHDTKTSLVMIAETISLGILSLPSALATVGIVPYVQLCKVTWSTTNHSLAVSYLSSASVSSQHIPAIQSANSN